MPQNFIACDRDQELLLPPSLREWLPAGHFAWFIVDAVAEMDMSAFYGVYRNDGHGRPAHDPAMMVALLLYAYARGERSSRRIERACVEDVAVRVIAGNKAPDHTTIARFRQRHEAALADLFSEVLSLCAEAGLVETGVVAIDGTKLHANAGRDANSGYEEIAREILEQADAVDREEDERYGPGSSVDVLPEGFAARRAGGRGCGRPANASSSAAPRRHVRSPARGLTGCASARAGSRKSWRWSATRRSARTRCGRPERRRESSLGAGRQSPTRRRPHRSGWSTPPTPTRAG